MQRSIKSGKGTWLMFGIGLVVLICWMIYRARRRRDYPLISLANAMQHMKTGDLILFSGRYIPLGSPDQMLRRTAFLAATYVYRALDASEWAHVAVVYRQKFTGKVFLLHAEPDTLPCVLAGVPVAGVQVTEVEEKLQKYLGYCVWRPINRAIPENKVLEFMRLTYPMHYRIPGDVWVRFFDRILKARRARGPAEPDYYRTSDGMFCTEWIGSLLEFCGVFDKTKSPYKNYYLPSDFTYKGCNRYLDQNEYGYTYENDGWEITME